MFPDSCVYSISKSRTGLFTILTNDYTESKEIEIYNTLGLLIKKQSLDPEDKQIDLRDHPNGVYTIRTIENKNIPATFIVLKE